jgi:hypothetical protein
LDAAINFNELCALLIPLGFQERTRGRHHIFKHPKAEEIFNLQPAGAQAKVYQVKPVRNVIMKYRLGGSWAALSLHRKGG